MSTLVKGNRSTKKTTFPLQELPREVYKALPAKAVSASDSSAWYQAKSQPDSLEKFFLRNSVPTQIFEFKAEQPAYILGAKGVELFIEPDSFVDVTGKTPKDNVQLHLQEVFRKSEMVLTNRPTLSKDRLLETGGALNIEVKQDYLPLTLQKPMIAEVPVSDRVKNPIAMQVFQGRMRRRQPFDETETFDWIPSEQNQLQLRRLSNRSVFALSLRALNWINCAYFFRSNEARTMITVQYDNVAPLQEQSAFLVFHDINAVARMYSKRDNRFTMFNIPVNHKATVIVVGMGQYGGFYIGKSNIERTSNAIIGIALQAAPEEEVVQRIRSAVI